jgi:hypothetical protein
MYEFRIAARAAMLYVGQHLTVRWSYLLCYVCREMD